MTSLGDITLPSKEKVEPSEMPDATYLSLEHIEADTGRILGCGKGVDVYSTKAVFRAGDVLYGKLRPYLNKVCIPDLDGICSTDILVFVQRRGVDNRYLKWFLSQRNVVEYANHHSTGVQLPRISFGKLAELDFPLPPFAEQQRVVAKVEALLARVNAARQRLAKVPVILKRFRQSVLAAACSGRLTADWRGKDPCSDQIEPTEGADQKPKEGWVQRKLREVVLTLEQGWSPKCELAPSPSLDVWAVMKTTAVQPLQFWEHENKRLPNHLAPRTELELKPGDILITRAGPRVRAGISCFVSTVRPRLIVCDKVYRFRVEEDAVLPKFVALALNAPATMEFIDTLKTGISDSGVNLTQAKFLDLELAFPPVSEQHEIVRRVEGLFRLADAIEKRVGAATARTEKLTQAILAKAFRGELVLTEAELARREGRPYEPASVLLERIRAEQPRKSGNGPK